VTKQPGSATVFCRRCNIKLKDSFLANVSTPHKWSFRDHKTIEIQKEIIKRKKLNSYISKTDIRHHKSIIGISSLKPVLSL